MNPFANSIKSFFIQFLDKTKIANPFVYLIIMAFIFVISGAVQYDLINVVTGNQLVDYVIATVLEVISAVALPVAMVAGRRTSRYLPEAAKNAAK